MNSAAHVDNDINNWKTMGMTKAELVIRIAEDCLGWPYVYGERGAYDTPAKRRSRADALDGSMPAEAAVIRKGCQVLNGSRGDCSGCKYYPGGAKTRCFDCRGFTYWVLLQVGITINGAGATSQWNTDANWKAKGKISDMPSGQVCCVFMHNSKTGKMDHTGLYVGGGRIIHCSGEVKIGKTTDKGWTHFAIPNGMEGDVPVIVTKPTLRKGASGPYVTECQEDLLKLGYDLSPYGADGKYGNTTIREVMKFQTASGLTADGICGPMTWAALDAAVAGASGSASGSTGGTASGSDPSQATGSVQETQAPAPQRFTVHIPNLQRYEADAYVASIPGAWMTEEGGETT